MKPVEIKHNFIELRAEGRSYDYIAKELHISKSTCKSWEEELSEEIASRRKAELETLYKCYGMTKEARIKRLGDTLDRIEDALAKADLTEIAPDKLLELKLKYREALLKEHIGTEEAYKLSDNMDLKDIVIAMADLLQRVRAGEVNTEQANRESIVLTNLLKAYEVADIKAKVDRMEAILESR